MKKKRIVKAVTLMIAILLLLPFMMTNQKVYAADNTNYGNIALDSNTEISDASLITLLTGEIVCASESAYIKENGEFDFLYCDTIPVSGITATWDVGTLYIQVDAWEYSAYNGKTVKWIPRSVTVNGIERTCTEENGVYKCVYADCFKPSDTFDISVEYFTDFIFSKDFYNSLVNFTYDSAEVISKELESYEYESEKYAEEESLYNEYLKEFEQYEKESEAYSQNESDWKAYEEKLAAYNKYLADREAYEEQSEKYDKFLEELSKYNKQNKLYEQYLKDKAAYTENLVAYRNFVLQVNARKDKLEFIENMFVKDSVGRSLYATLMGDTVATVVSHKQEIVNYAVVDAAAVDAAGQCTENLQRLLTGYKNCTTEKEKYRYYEANYSEIKENIKNLYECLYSFYGSRAVRVFLGSKGKLERYRMFVSQLYVIASGLDDSKTRDPNWLLGYEDEDRFGVDHFLEECHILEDKNNSNPSGLSGWPAEVIEPTEPNKVEKPTAPASVAIPGNPPSAVVEPQKPIQMEKPIAPNEVKAPGNPPAKFEMTASEKAILASYKSGELKKRPEIHEDFVLKKTKTVHKFVEALGKHYVSFICNGEVVSYSNVFEDEDVIAPEAPELTSEKYVYTFEGWVDSEGNYWTEETRVTKDKEYYAKYSSELRKYDITWIVDGRKEIYKCEYGSVPEYTGNTEKNESEYKCYSFIGWDNKPAKVTGDATYTALYSETDRYYTVSWNVDGKIINEQYKYNETPVFKGNTLKEADSQYVYTFKCWHKDIETVKENTTYICIFKTDPIVPMPNGGAYEVKCENATMSIESKQNSLDVKNLIMLAEKNEYSIRIKMNDMTVNAGSLSVKKLAELGVERLDLSYTSDNDGNYSVVLDMGKDVNDIDITVEFSLDKHLNATYFRVMDNGERQEIDNSEGVAKLRLTKSGEVKIIAVYEASMNDGENGNSSLSENSSTAGEKITLNVLSVDYGYYISEVKVHSKLTGEYVDFDLESMSFLMPVGGADVEVVYSRKEFTITFMCDGKVISSEKYYMGDDVNIPYVQQVIVDDQYHYTFKGWDNPVIAVVGDATYNAVYAKTVLANQNTMNEYGYKNRTYMYFVYGGILLLGISGVTTLIVVVSKKRKKKKLNILKDSDDK